ncbi:MAG: hypothetical protein H0U97_20550 [Gammaproteobacteria bacterium]|nr:hypothetical protein [Gammaproteobacteria bacterium]
MREKEAGGESADGRAGLSNDKVADILMSEYRDITLQIIHWDTFFWTKSGFFLGFEGIALGATMSQLLRVVASKIAMTVLLFGFLLGMVTLNLFLRYIWFLTGRRNRDFLGFRFEWGKQIEEHPLLRGIVELYHHQDTRLRSPKLQGKFSHYWEINIPFLFALTWLLLLIAGLVFLRDKYCAGLGASLLVALVSVIAVRVHDRSMGKFHPSEAGDAA